MRTHDVAARVAGRPLRLGGADRRQVRTFGGPADRVSRSSRSRPARRPPANGQRRSCSRSNKPRRRCGRGPHIGATDQFVWIGSPGPPSRMSRNRSKPSGGGCMPRGRQSFCLLDLPRKSHRSHSKSPIERRLVRAHVMCVGRRQTASERRELCPRQPLHNEVVNVELAPLSPACSGALRRRHATMRIARIVASAATENRSHRELHLGVAIRIDCRARLVNAEPQWLGILGDQPRSPPARRAASPPPEEFLSRAAELPHWHR